MTYIFPKASLLAVLDHATSLDIEVLSLTLNQEVYELTTAQSFPSEQLAHLGLTEV